MAAKNNILCKNFSVYLWVNLSNDISMRHKYHMMYSRKDFSQLEIQDGCHFENGPQVVNTAAKHGNISWSDCR